MSCQTTPYDSKRIAFSRSELQIINQAEVEFAASLSKFYQLLGDYIGLDLTIKANTLEFQLPVDSILVDGKLRNIWVFVSYETTDYESTDCLEWAFTEDSPSDVRWYPLSKVLALSGIPTDDNSFLIKPIMLRNTSSHDVKIKIIATA